MNMKTKLILGAICLFLTGCGPEMMPAAKPTDPHAHKWAKWSTPETTTDWYNGTKQWQSRVCDTCGIAESRVTLISPGSK